MTESTELYGLVLAGGRSRRMGQDKALLDRGGKSQLEYAYALLDGVTARCFVSTRTDQSGDEARSRFPRIADKYDDLGPAAGILSAMDEHPGVDWLIIACDLPNLDAETLEFLIADSPADKPFTAYRSSYDDLPEPLCAIYRHGSGEIVRGFVDEGIKCPRKMLIRSDTALLEQPDPASLDNVNTPEDLAASNLSRTA